MASLGAFILPAVGMADEAGWKIVPTVVDFYPLWRHRKTGSSSRVASVDAVKAGGWRDVEDLRYIPRADSVSRPALRVQFVCSGNYDFPFERRRSKQRVE